MAKRKKAAKAKASKAKASKAKPPKAKSAARKSAPRKAAAHAAPGSGQLHQLIGDLLAARQRGDYAASQKASAALDSFHKRAGPAVRQAAAEAKAFAANPVAVDSQRLLEELAARVRTPAV